MITLAIILAIMAIALFFALNSISSKRISSVNALEKEKRSLEGKLEFMLNQRSELQKEIKEKEHQIASLKYNQEGIKTYSASELDIKEENDDDKVSRYLLSEGKITLEQNEKILNKMALLKLDFIGASLALGFIDLETAQKAMKVNKITTKRPNDNI